MLKDAFGFTYSTTAMSTVFQGPRDSRRFAEVRAPRNAFGFRGRPNTRIQGFAPETDLARRNHDVGFRACCFKAQSFRYLHDRSAGVVVGPVDARRVHDDMCWEKLWPDASVVEPPPPPRAAFITVPLALLVVQ